MLVKRVSDRAMQTLRKEAKQRKKSSLDLTGDKAGADDEDRDLTPVENAKEQITALLSFKEAFCSGESLLLLLLVVFAH